MEIEFESSEKHIREIEDIIDIQKANGSLTRQVGFSLPPPAAAPAPPAPIEGEGGGEQGADVGPGAGGRKQRRGRRAERQTGSPARPRARAAAARAAVAAAAATATDGVSWPSDSDITVLRVARCAGSACSGDGSSMVNLATLVQPSQPASKHSLLLPLSSWPAAPAPATAPAPPAHLAPAGADLPEPPDADEPPEPRKARLARFLRLYFCPCCTCLYEMEHGPRRPPPRPRRPPNAPAPAPAPDTPYVYYTAR